MSTRRSTWLGTLTFALSAAAFAAGPSSPGAGGSSAAARAPQNAQMTAKGAQRFREDLGECNHMTGEAKQTCLREMYAARAQGLYRD